MKFDKINFVLNILSSETIVSGQQNYIKLFVVDTIAETDIASVEYKLSMPDGRNTPTEVQDWSELSIAGTFYDSSFTPELTKAGQLELAVRITDINSNVYILKANMEGVL